MDNWQHRSEGMLCRTCMYFVVKVRQDHQSMRKQVGRCRYMPPTMKGFPVVYQDDWCGQHRIDENKINETQKTEE